MWRREEEKVDTQWEGGRLSNRVNETTSETRAADVNDATVDWKAYRVRGVLIEGEKKSQLACQMEEEEKKCKWFHVLCVCASQLSCQVMWKCWRLPCPSFWTSWVWGRRKIRSKRRERERERVEEMISCLDGYNRWWMRMLPLIYSPWPSKSLEEHETGQLFVSFNIFVQSSDALFRREWNFIAFSLKRRHHYFHLSLSSHRCTVIIGRSQGERERERERKSESGFGSSHSPWSRQCALSVWWNLKFDRRKKGRSQCEDCSASGEEEEQEKKRERERRKQTKVSSESEISRTRFKLLRSLVARKLSHCCWYSFTFTWGTWANG